MKIREMCIMTSEVVAIVGAGVMGSDVAIDFASHNYRVILKDITDEILENARGNIKRSYSFVKMMKRALCKFIVLWRPFTLSIKN